MKTALLCVSFGTTVPAAEKDIKAVEQALHMEMPEADFFRGFTSRSVCRVLASRGEAVWSAEEALEHLTDGSYDRVVIQPTHFLYGLEYERLKSRVEEAGKRFPALSLGVPLLSCTEDLQMLARILSEEFPERERTAMVFMGHGTSHFSNMVYPAMESVLHMMGRKDVYVGTVEGWPGIGEISSRLQTENYTHVRMAPLMLAAGDHALGDMAGDDVDSWKSILVREGYEVECILQGLGILPRVQELYRQHLRKLLNQGEENRMTPEYYIRSGQKLLRCGYTTGTCAALAASGATAFLLSGKAPEILSLTTPKGNIVEIAPAFLMTKGETAICGVVKDGGDDADVTHGLTVEAHVRKSCLPGISIDGGEGVGRVTKPGLDQPVGFAAINRMPRQMIEEQVRQVCDALGYDGGVEVIICIPGGREAAQKTFNPMLGVEGGLSVLGTTGVVEPMSERALVDTIAVELRQAKALEARRIILTPGNYGEAFLRENSIAGGAVPVIRCSNFIGEALDIAGTYSFEEILLAGHIGKLVKLAGGVMNTHSRYADCRTELICAHAAVCGASWEVCAALMQAATTEACIKILDSVHLREQVLDSLLDAVQRHLEYRAQGKYKIGAVLFSNQCGLSWQTQSAKEMMESWK